MRDINQLINERTQAIEKLEAWVGTIEADGRDMTPEEVERYNTEHDAVGEITNRIERARQLEALRGLTPATDPQPAAGDPQGGELPVETVPGTIGLTVKQARQFNILKAVQATIDGDWRGAEFERECSQAVADSLGYGPRSFFVPTEVLAVPRPEMRQITKAGDGADLVGTEHMAGSFIDLLRNRAVVGAAGARMLTGLVGDLSIPRMASGTTTAPVRAARPTEIPMVIMATRDSFMPIKLATSRSSAVARMARPNFVFINMNQSPARTKRAAPKVISCW